jgi:hypothetical protein
VTVDFSGVAPSAAAVIRDLYQATKGEGLAPAIVDAARDPASPLHRYFEWNDTTAAALHRVATAEQLIRRVRVTIIPADDAAPVRVRAYVATRELKDAATAIGDTDTADAPAGSYRALEDIAGQTAFEAAVLDSIRVDIRRLSRKHAGHQAVFRAALTDWLEEGSD